MTHHVIQYASALKLTLPEPRHVRTAVLLCGAREIRPPCERRTACPDELLPTSDVGSEKLVLEIARVESHARCESSNLLRFGNIAGERLLACEALQVRAAFYRRN